MKQSIETMEALLAIHVDPFLTTQGDFTVRMYCQNRFGCDTPDGFKLLTAKEVQKKFGTYM